MTSAINPANPVHGNPTTESVRDNFAIAAQEISNLQTQVAGLLLNMPYLPLAGATMTGSLVLAGDPQVDAEAATKIYVDAQGALYLPLAGATMTGPLLLAADPAADTEAATKAYVDALLAQITDLEARVAALENPTPPP